MDKPNRPAKKDTRRFKILPSKDGSGPGIITKAERDLLLKGMREDEMKAELKARDLKPKVEVWFDAESNEIFFSQKSAAFKDTWIIDYDNGIIHDIAVDPKDTVHCKENFIVLLGDL